ncbi:terminase small subunit [Burkholderia multivorans]|uniref:terminase small subunit n=1 Tax=Burkholderia multivorans TaxID=87883 RepID=UPI0021C17850|nr:terminase small subunit [Burkholderia multivorans]MDR9052077.1 hypothetical protein [Burkholderia multivorans]MDR9060149.1 hypothetical protein [Burkholderia multivorans]MDR9062454.1 hypothetical protein [Burkholderia multivorans]MDR9072198.1 hypothetical protein [Burkholderia multivorans]MDR9076523.1 hypothetical protein [Burkholderia multivorans]
MSKNTIHNPKPKRLSARDKRFVDEYLVDLDVVAAAIRAGFSGSMARSKAYLWVSESKQNPKPHLYAAILKAQEDLAARTHITQEMVLKRYWEIATADPNELVQYRRLCCRHCWGIGHAYQWTEAEFEKAQADASDDGPDCSGGFGFDPNREPNAECPECGGYGKGKVHVNDTRKLEGPARLLYAGVKVGKEGLEVKMHDQLKALDAVARHIGFDKSKVEISGPNGKPIAISGTAQEMTDEQLLAIIEAGRDGAHGSPAGKK